MRSTIAAVPAKVSTGSAGLSEGTKLTPLLYTKWRQIPERVFAVLLFVPLFPLLATLVAIVRLTSKGPGIFRQTRVGLEGSQFVLYKLRTMRVDAETKSGPVWSQPGDPRVTPIGKFLRWSHLDELPQLWNVVRGEMSLIGPRPERPEFTEQLAQQIPGYLGRLHVPPGITGLAQVILPPDSDLTSVKSKLEMDLEYISRANPWLDVQILFCTALRLIGFRNWFARRLLASSSAGRADAGRIAESAEEASLARSVPPRLSASAE
jgi:lipopolysaccharide/colanic/teichoic acid biosynthesis glycosyltransferase